MRKYIAYMVLNNRARPKHKMKPEVMIMLKSIDTKELGYSEYSDSRSNTHIIKHSVTLTRTEKRELEEKIADELYRIFTHKVV